MQYIDKFKDITIMYIFKQKSNVKVKFNEEIKLNIPIFQNDGQLYVLPSVN